MGAFTTIADGTAVPSGDGVGTAMATVPGRHYRNWSTLITIVASGNFSTNITCWARDVAGNFARLGPTSGDVNGGTAFEGAAGTHRFHLGGEFLGLPVELYYQSSDNTNITGLTVAVAPYGEQ
jgi:hypothetical protein